MMEMLLISLIFCLAPAGMLWLCRKVPLLDKIGPALPLYVLGILLGNIGLANAPLHTAQTVFSNAMVPLAIPLMLFGCTFRKSEIKNHFTAMLTGLLAVIATVIAGYFLFGVRLPEGEKVGGMLTGVYTGGTINLAALKAMLDVEESTYILVNSYDMIASFLYLTFLLAAGIRLFRKFLPNRNADFTENDREELEKAIRQTTGNPYKGLFTRKGLKIGGFLLGVTLLICAVSGGVALLLPEELFMTVFILMLTTLGIAASFIKKVHDSPYGYDIGMYLIYVFCIAVASMADFRNIDLEGGLNLLGYLLFVVFGSLFLQVLLARLFRTDSDTTVITSVAFINSPPFVPLIAAAMRNRKVLVAGLSIGIIGYAAGNYLGFLIARLLEWLG